MELNILARTLAERLMKQMEDNCLDYREHVATAEEVIREAIDKTIEAAIAVCDKHFKECRDRPNCHLFDADVIRSLKQSNSGRAEQGLPVVGRQLEILEARRLGMEEAFDLCAVIADEGHDTTKEYETGTGSLSLVGLGAKINAEVIRSRKEFLIAARMKELTPDEQQEETPNQSPAPPSN